MRQQVMRSTPTHRGLAGRLGKPPRWWHVVGVFAIAMAGSRIGLALQPESPALGHAVRRLSSGMGTIILLWMTIQLLRAAHRYPGKAES